MAYGVRACALTLKTYHDKGIRTVGGIVARWAPPHENDTTAFAVYVSSGLGVVSDEVIPMMEYGTMRRLVELISAYENVKRPSGADLDEGLAMAGLKP